jgi:hypothetical protein
LFEVVALRERERERERRKKRVMWTGVKLGCIASGPGSWEGCLAQEF